MQIKAAPLTDDAFGPFGEIVVPRTAGRSANADMTRRCDHVVNLNYSS
jgi:ureidoglycolate hydrolase